MQAAYERPSPTPLPWLRSVVALAVVLVLGAAVYLAVQMAQRPSYRRFVSKPLPDGSRFTFLYPAHLEQVVEGGGGSPEVMQSTMVYTPDQSDSNWAVVGRQLGFRIPLPGESVTVVVVPLKTGRVREARRNERWARGGFVRHNERLVDARTRTELMLMHQCPSTAATQFEAHNPQIVRSFRVLPPGAEPE